MSETTAILKMLRSPAVEDRKRFAQVVIQERADTIAALLAELTAWSGAEDATTLEVDSTAHLAILLLGELRASEAAPILIRYIKVRDAAFDSRVSEDKRPLDAHFPALRALIQIGEPSIPYLLDAIAFARDPLTVQLAVIGVTRIAGPDTARFHLSSFHTSLRNQQTQGDAAHVATALSLVDSPTTIVRLRPEAMVDSPKRKA